MAKASPAFQFYAADFDTATRSWLPEEVGVYMRLLCSQWINGTLPSDKKRLASIAGMSSSEFDDVWKTIGQKFHETDSGHVNKRLENVREEQRKYREKQQESGRKGAQKRWGKDGNPNGGANGDPISDPNGEAYGQNIALHTSSSTSSLSSTSDLPKQPYPEGDSTVVEITTVGEEVA